MKTSTKRHFSWPLVLILFNLSRLIPYRNKRLWLYGAWAGERYDDNSKYLFEYINANYKREIRSVWLANTPEAVEKVRSKGYEAYLNSSWMGRWLQLRAGVACYTNGLLDFGVIPLVGGAEVVALWHGMGFKKIYNGKYHGIKLLLKKLLDRLYSWTYRSLTPVTSEYAKRWVDEMFTLDKRKVFITGQPRNDAFRQIEKEVFLSHINVDIDKNIVLYMPTYRKPTLGREAMSDLIRVLYESKELDTYLNNANSVFVAKLHPLTPRMIFENRENFIILDKTSVENTQELLGMADALVTDYSSCFIDYALLERPIVFYVPDEERFLAQSEKVEEEFFEIERLCMATTPLELSEKLQSSEILVAKMTNAMFEDESIKGTYYSENVYKMICMELGLN